MNKGEHPANLNILREHVIRYLESQIEALRSAVFSSRVPAKENYDNSLRLADSRFIVIKQGLPVHGETLRYCVGIGSTVRFEPEQPHYFDRTATRDTWDAIARERAPWVALRLIQVAVSE